MDDAFFTNIPSGAALLWQLAPQHTRLQPVSQGVPMTGANQWNFTTLNDILLPVLNTGDHSPELQLATGPHSWMMRTGICCRPTSPPSPHTALTWCATTTPGVRRQRCTLPVAEPLSHHLVGYFQRAEWQWPHRVPIRYPLQPGGAGHASGRSTIKFVPSRSPTTVASRNSTFRPSCSK